MRTAIAVVIAIAFACDTAFDQRQVAWFSPVAAFQPVLAKSAPMISFSTTESDRSRDFRVLSPLSFVPPSNTALSMALGQKNKNKNGEDDEAPVSKTFWKDLGKKPGNLIMLPFIAIVGFDLVINIAFMTKRAVEYFVFGKIPSTETWF